MVAVRLWYMTTLARFTISFVAWCDLNKSFVHCLRFHQFIYMLLMVKVAIQCIRTKLQILLFGLEALILTYHLPQPASLLIFHFTFNTLSLI